MTRNRKWFILLSTLTVLNLIIVSGCKKEDKPADFTTYKLEVKDLLGISGTVTFTETSTTSTTIDIVLVNAPSGSHPASLCEKSTIEKGAVVIALNPVDATGKSTTTTTEMTYTQLISYDGFIKVRNSSSEPNTIIAQADIGGNLLTSMNKIYPLVNIGAFGVSGNALFEERLNGNTLVTITLTGTIAGADYPASINLSSIASVGGGPVVKLLNDVEGSLGKSFTNIRKLDSGIDITYNDWLIYDGYLNIYQAPVKLENIICHGNIGSN